MIVWMSKRIMRRRVFKIKGIKEGRVIIVIVKLVDKVIIKMIIAYGHSLELPRLKEGK